MKKITSLLFITLLTNLSLSSQTLSESNVAVKPISFKENKGQVSDQYSNSRPDILFSGTAGDMVFHLKNDGISYQLNRVDEWIKKEGLPVRKNSREKLVPSKSTIYRLDINWLNSNSNPQISRGEALSGFDNYYFASCPNGALNVKSYTNILYKNIYSGIDLKWYEKNGSLEYDYYVAANSDYKKIQLEYKGAEKIYVDRSGTLVIETPLGIIKEQKPLVTQNDKLLNANWIVKNDVISFDIKNVDPLLPLIIDPMVRLWGTYYGGSSNEDAWYTHVDAADNVYISGSTKSASNIATSGAQQNAYGGLSNHTDGYIVKFNANGVRQWATYYGGTGDDYAAESIADASGNVFLTGGTTSTNTGVIATPGSHQAVLGSTATQGDAFLVMLNSSGIRQWGTYYGGGDSEVGYGLSLDNSGNIYMCGASQSTNAIATAASYQPTLAAGLDGFLVKFNSGGVRQWGTYYGGNGYNEILWDCATNTSGDTYVCGVTTSSTGISTPGSHQAVYGGGTSDAFFAKFNSSGAIQWGSYYGDAGEDDGVNCSLDPSGNFYFAGHTNSSTGTVIASLGSYQALSAGANDAYLVKFNSNGVRLWGTYFGGTGNELGYTANADVFGNVYLSGQTSTATGTKIATPCSYQSVSGGSIDAFLAKFTGAGVRLWSTFYGGSSVDSGNDCRADTHGNIYMCGTTSSASNSVMATSNGHQTGSGGGTDAFLVKFDGCIPGIAPNTTSPLNMLVCSGNSATLTTTCGNWYNTATGTTVLGTGSTFTTGPLVSDSTFYIEEFSCGSVSGTRTAVSITLSAAPTLTVANSNPAACVNESITLSAFGAANYTWTGLFSTSPTSTLLVYVLLNSTYSVVGVGANGCQSTATLAVIPNLCLGINKQENTNSFVSIYPNPNNGAFTIQSGSNLNLVLTNELGQTIRALTLSPANNFNVELDDLPGGIYFLKGEKESRVVNQKIIVLK